MLARILTDGQQAVLAAERRVLGELVAALSRLDVAADDQDTLSRSVAQLDELFLLVVVGEFNAGKSAFINALLMLAVVVGISVEAVRRLLAPSPVAGGMVMAIAAAGLLINMFAAWSLSHGHSLNSRAALLHVSGDMLGSVAAIVAGAVVASTGWMPIDPILSLLVAVLVLRSTWLLLKASTHVLMEGVPAHLSYEEIGRALTRVPGVAAVHDLHVWQMTSERAALSAHLLIRDAQAWPQVLAAAQRLLADRYQIDHVTLQPAWHQQPADKRVIPLTPIAGDDKPHMH